MKLMTGSSFKEYVHYGYEVVSLSSKTASAVGQLGADEEQKRMVHMEGRAGVFVNTDVVLDALAKRAEDETRKRNLSADAARVRDISEKIAVGALRYNLTKVDTNKIIVFDLDDALDLEGETGPYIQYARVRATGILEKAMIQSEEPVDASLLTAAEEIDLIKELSKFPSTVEASAHSLTPQRICRYAHRLAMLFNDFYEKHRVIGADRKELMIARLRLVECVKTVLENSLGLLGIPVPDAM
jgi:arginyl-tRNA synthetase